jgi:hypothetical protein
MGGSTEQLATPVGQEAKLLQREGMQASGFGGVNAPAVPDLLEQGVE